MTLPSNKTATAKKIVRIQQAQEKFIDEVSQRLTDLETKIEKQDDKNKNIVYGVLFAAFFVFVAIAVEIVISDRDDKQFYSGLQENVYEQKVLSETVNIKMNNMEKDMEDLRLKNPYLK